ncbi:MAG TPA: hypothetical protein VF140_04655 [Phycicoccus sp.]
MSQGTVRLDGDGSSVEVATGFGPRVVGLLVDGRNLFAELPDDDLEVPDGRRYRLRGGHRLWVAPEEPVVTYQPDDEPCDVTMTDGGIRIDGPPDGAGIAKTIEMSPAADGWVVDHTIANRGPASRRVGPWAITQLRAGGRATLALGGDRDGMQADRAVVLWPYTDPSDPRLRLTRDAVEVAAAAGMPTKVGVAGGTGEGVYELDGVRLRKRVAVRTDAAYADLGAAVQVYVHDRFCELETLGPLVDLAPGEAVTHREEWSVSGARP